MAQRLKLASIPNRRTRRPSTRQVRVASDTIPETAEVEGRFAFAVLNIHHPGPNGRRHTSDNTVVIASSVSNGGGASFVSDSVG